MTFLNENYHRKSRIKAFSSSHGGEGGGEVGVGGGVGCGVGVGVAPA